MVNQGQKQTMKNGTGGMSGGNILSNTSKHGNINWKYLLRNYSVKLLTPDEVDESLRESDTCGLVTSNHVSNRSNGNFAKRKCGACGEKGHSRGQKKCNIEGTKTQSVTKNIIRVKRKREEMRALDNVIEINPNDR